MADALLLLEGSRFWLCDGRGDAVGGTQGLFDSDVRHLSAWRLRLNGEPLHLLSSQNLTLSTARIFGTISGAHVEHNPSITVMREQRVEDALKEKIVLENHSPSTCQIELTLEFEADFKDIFELKRDAFDGERPNLPSATRTSDSVTLLAREDGWQRSSVVSFDCPPSSENDGRTEFVVELPPRTRWGLSIVVSSHGSGLDEDDRVPYQQWSVEDGPGHRDETSPGTRADRPRPLAGVEEFVRAAPEIVSESELVTRTYRQSLVDLAALRFYPERERSTCVLAAGLPWFMALFGRDSLIAAYQALPFAPDLARSTLVTLARYQATEDDPYRDAEPGKILHELRRGKLAALKRIPHTPYYGSHDASPLFLILLDEYERWTGDSALVAELKSSALEALAWIETSGDRDGDGYLEYQTRSPDGLVNHCWKDSWSSIAFSGGELAGGRSRPARSRATPTTPASEWPVFAVSAGEKRSFPAGSKPTPARSKRASTRTSGAPIVITMLSLSMATSVASTL